MARATTRSHASALCSSAPVSKPIEVLAQAAPLPCGPSSGRPPQRHLSHEDVGIGELHDDNACAARRLPQHLYSENSRLDAAKYRLILYPHPLRGETALLGVPIRMAKRSWGGLRPPFPVVGPFAAIAQCGKVWGQPLLGAIFGTISGLPARP